MVCEKCAREIEEVTCGSCGSVLIKLGRFCYLCGAGLTEQSEGRGQDAEHGLPGEQEGSEVDFSNRILCSDGTCIGVINDRGVCKVCGKPYTQEP